MCEAFPMNDGVAGTLIDRALVTTVAREVNSELSSPAAAKLIASAQHGHLNHVRLTRLLKMLRRHDTVRIAVREFTEDTDAVNITVLAELFFQVTVTLWVNDLRRSVFSIERDRVPLVTQAVEAVEESAVASVRVTDQDEQAVRVRECALELRDKLTGDARGFLTDHGHVLFVVALRVLFTSRCHQLDAPIRLTPDLYLRLRDLDELLQHRVGVFHPASGFHEPDILTLAHRGRCDDSEGINVTEGTPQADDSRGSGLARSLTALHCDPAMTILHSLEQPCLLERGREIECFTEGKYIIANVFVERSKSSLE